MDGQAMERAGPGKVTLELQIRGEGPVAKGDETERKKKPSTNTSIANLKSSGDGQWGENSGEGSDGRQTEYSDSSKGRTEISRRRPVLITLDGRRVSERFIITSSKTILGRETTADIPVSDGEVSRQHCLIQWTNFGEHDEADPVCEIEDLGSTNGTFINGSSLIKRVTLRDGDQIRIGRTVLGFFLKDERVLELDQLLLSMALNDSLTGLYKREFFFGELQREFDRSRRHGRTLSLAVVDLDFFKSVNDQYGHLRGDEALRQVADAIRATLRDGDLCARFGGEEFAIIFPETDAKGAYEAAERFRKAIEGRVFVIGRNIEIRLTISVGVASRRDVYRDKMQLLEEADKALYLAKAAGRNRTIVSPGDGNQEEITGKPFDII
jgi:diguanylate cyclase (GGDEF)-like protein